MEYGPREPLVHRFTSVPAHLAPAHSALAAGLEKGKARQIKLRLNAPGTDWLHSNLTIDKTDLYNVSPPIHSHYTLHICIPPHPFPLHTAAVALLSPCTAYIQASMYCTLIAFSHTCCCANVHASTLRLSVLWFVESRSCGRRARSQAS